MNSENQKDQIMPNKAHEYNLECLHYFELADLLGLDERTMRNRWRDYPHFFVTSNGWKRSNLRSARFNYFEVLEYCRKQSDERGNDSDAFV